MKKIVVSILVMLSVIFSGLNVNAFQKMDICNSTNGDTSGNYYDGLCTKDGKKADINTFIFTDVNTDNDSNKLSDLNSIKNTYSNKTFILNNKDNLFKKEITKKDSIISKLTAQVEELISKIKKLVFENEKLITENNNLKTKLEDYEVLKQMIEAKGYGYIDNSKKVNTAQVSNKSETIAEKIKRVNLAKKMKKM